MTDRRSGGRVGHEARGAPLFCSVSRGRTGSLISPMFANEISMLRKPYRLLKDNQVQQDNKKNDWLTSEWQWLPSRPPLSRCNKTSGRICQAGILQYFFSQGWWISDPSHGLSAREHTLHSQPPQCARAPTTKTSSLNLGHDLQYVRPNSGETMQTHI